MKKRLATFAAIAATVSTAPLALAHGTHSTDNTLYHYLTSPDHVLNMFAVAALSLLAVVWAARRTAAAVPRKRR